jgi:hypothetical protein
MLYALLGLIIVLFRAQIALGLLYIARALCFSYKYSFKWSFGQLL